MPNPKLLYDTRTSPRWTAPRSRLFEVIVYSAALSDTDIAAVEEYLADKWGL